MTIPYDPEDPCAGHDCAAGCPCKYTVMPAETWLRSRLAIGGTLADGWFDEWTGSVGPTFDGVAANTEWCQAIETMAGDGLL